MTHDCGHVVYVFHTWLIVMSHGFRACEPLGAHDLFYGFWLVVRYGAADSYELAEGFDTMTHYESGVAWRKGMSHAGLGLREEPLYKGTLGAWDLSQEPFPLHLWRLKSQHHKNSWSTSTTPALSVSCTRTLSELHPHSQWAAPALSVSCTRTLRELHPPPPALLPLSCPWALVSLFLGVVWLCSPQSPLAFRYLA